MTGKGERVVSSLIERYNALSGRLKEIEDELGRIRKAVSGIEDKSSQTIPARIEHLESQLEKIDDYELKVKAFRQLAEQHITSKNLLTIQAPAGYRVNLNRLKNWSMMIDPMSLDDPYAQKVYLVAKCDEKFLSDKREEFKGRIAGLQKEMETGNSAEIEALNRRAETLYAERRQYAGSEEMEAFAGEVAAANQAHIFPEEKTVYQPEPSDFLVPGAYGLPLDFDEDQRILMKEKLGMFYSRKDGRIFLPVEKIRSEKEFVLAVNCVPSRNVIRQMDAGIRNFLLNIIDHAPAGSRRILIADAERQSTALAGSAKGLQDTFAMEYIPRTDEQMTAMLENLAASFADMDELMGDYDTVADYNADAASDKQLPRRVLVVVGWPDSVKSGDQGLLRRILANYERYGISLILVRIHSFKEDAPAEKISGLTEYASEEMIRIDMNASGSVITFDPEHSYRFAWYPFKGNLSEEYIASLKEKTVRAERPDNEYTQHFDMQTMPAYSRAYQKLELPYGMDAKGQIHSLSFENENFAAYLVGASRSGKSTLLHTLIAGIIRNYHPDNVELWLADFKQLEFEKYITHIPPHVRYVLLDESTELVYDLIDKLTEKMMERQHLFARLGKERIDQIDVTVLDRPLPLIFVILDEFSIMSQSIADSPTYKLRLQNLLAKGAALGIRFLFSSQTFTTGVAGLTQTARAQIQQRIAMKGSREEIAQTLELSSRLMTEQVRNWMDALPPHYTLVKSRKDADTPPEVHRNLVLYFRDYTVRDNLINRLNKEMIPADSYEPGNLNSYVNKHPVLVDGKAYEKYPADRLAGKIRAHREEDGTFDHEVYVSPGTPRLMSDMKLVTLTAETRENVLLLARGAEQACAGSVISSYMRAFLEQGHKVSVWAYGKNSLYRWASEKVWTGPDYKDVSFHVDQDAVCDAIYALKDRIRKREPSDELIVLVGMDRIGGDFEFGEGAGSLSGGIGPGFQSFDPEEYARKRKQREEELIKKGAVVTSQEQEAGRKRALAWVKEKRRLQAEYKAQGLSDEEIRDRLRKDNAAFVAQDVTGPADNKAVKPAPAAETEKKTAEPAGKPVEEAGSGHKAGAYNAAADFAEIIRQGSRLGYHFMMVLNDYSDLKQTSTKIDLYRHRMSFATDVETARELFSGRAASELPEHICQYSNRMEQFSFRPYLHPGITWEGWYVDEKGELVSPFAGSKD